MWLALSLDSWIRHMFFLKIPKPILVQNQELGICVLSAGGESVLVESSICLGELFFRPLIMVWRMLSEVGL